MRRRILFTLALLIIAAPLFAQNHEANWEAGNKLYQEGQYAEAADEYLAIVESGFISSDLFYNIGNCYYKLGDTAHAILFYNRALREKPTDIDIKYNLDLANALITSKIEPIPQFFLVRWINNLGQTFSSDTWATISLYALALALLFSGLFVFSRTRDKRKAFFTIALVGFVIFVFSLIYAVNEKNHLLNSGEAIVMESSAAVKSSPDKNGKDLFILDAGIKVRVSEKVGRWSHIEIASGNRGWIENSKIESIDLPAKK